MDPISSFAAEVSEEQLTERLDGALLRGLYSYMLKCRLVEEGIRLLFRQGRFAGNYLAAVGQEATEVGATIDLLPEDTIAPSHRNFVVHIMKGTPLRLMFARIYGRKTSPDQGRSATAHCGYASLNIITPASTIAAQLNIGTGVALAYKMQRTAKFTASRQNPRLVEPSPDKATTMLWVTISGCENRRMQDRELCRQILGIEAPWFVERVELKLAGGKCMSISNME